MTERNIAVIDGREWTAAELADRCRITPSAARTRLRRWRRGELDDGELLHAGKRHAGGNPGVKNARHATAEWKALDDSWRSMAAIDTTPGTWEREHLRPVERKITRKYVRSADRENGDKGAVYYNPARVAL